MADANIAVSDLNNYLSFRQGIDLERDKLIERYFKLGLKYKEICLFLLSLQGIEISVRHLKRILRQRQLGRRRNPSLHSNDVYEALHEEIEGSGSSIGYRYASTTS
ncbi:Hypothetical predicted protein [Paramuricea clavata]|uniref:Uncharacterized protein n=1 Tax=Paramuricea clavata TaxID=317549 RepID=A0A6S7KMR0_PARCT|nr:Hypothetical predicted protein [Paramuricea clavata]